MSTNASAAYSQALALLSSSIWWASCDQLDGQLDMARDDSNTVVGAPTTVLASVLIVDVVHPELFEFAGERVAAPAQELRGVLSVALGVPECDADQSLLECRQRVIQQRPRRRERLSIGPGGEGAGPVLVGRCVRDRADDLRRQVFRPDFIARRQHGEAAA